MEPTDHNRRAWDAIHRQRAEAMEDRLGIPELVRERLPDLSGRHVLHLQCGTGESTAELEQLGALVTGVDISAEAIAAARTRAPNAAFIQADAQSLPLELRRGRFELVYTGGGVLTRLQDVDAWAAGIVGALRHGGFLLFYDAHPVLACLDDFLHWRESYFETGHEGSFWQLGQVATALAQAGLTIRRLEEFPALHSWQRQDARVPGDFILTAAKP